MLTLINRLRRCAADTDRCTGADEKSPPGGNKKQTKKKPAFICKDTVTVSFVPSHSVSCGTCTRTHRAYLVTLQRSSSSQGLLTDLAYFLEVELWQGMEPVGQLSEVEKLHLKPESESTDRLNGRKKEEARSRQ